MVSKGLNTNLAPFLDVLAERAILADGGMATMIYQKGVYINQSFENVNLIRPHLIKNIHLEYLQAGAELLETNTFSANRQKLAKYGLADKVAEINRSGVRLAREAAGGKAWIAGVVGPPGRDVEGDFKALSREEVKELYKEQIGYLIEAGVDILSFMTFSHLPTLRLAIETAKEINSDIPCVAMVLVDHNHWTRFGDDQETIGRALNAMPAEVVGLNDGPGPAKLVAALGEIAPYIKKPIALFPGTGLPVEHEDRFLSMETPEYYMEIMRQGMQHGARFLGGSCGCHPEHIRAVHSSIKMLQPGEAKSDLPEQGGTAVITSSDIKQEIKIKDFDTPSKFQQKLREGKFVVSVEIDPPVGTDATKSIEAARKAADSGRVDCINIADGPRATARMGPMDMAMLLRDQVPNIESMVHFCCRDRNILGMQADLIGANALGVHNILMITGDPPKLGDYPFATAVYDVDAIGALKIGSNLNSGMDLAGNPMRGKPTELFQGCGANPGAIDLGLEVSRLEQKVMAGANFILTQPVYDSELFFKFHERIKHLKVPLLLGILPLASYRNAEFLTKEVPGMYVPQDIRDRLKACPDKDAARDVGIDVARSALKQALPYIQGTYIMPPFNRIESALAVLDVVDLEG
jgi:methionine synthase / methylenetetrahydrofolate reductase (NADH)